MPVELIISETASHAADRAAQFFAYSAKAAALKKGFFAVAISGGTTPRGMHRILGKPPVSNSVPWDLTHIFWVDERCVPADDPASNYGAAHEDFLARVKVPRENVHPMPVLLPPHEGAAIYEKELELFFKLHGSEAPVFDLIFLGLGVDGHIASLFPGHEATLEDSRRVITVTGGEPRVPRLTLTLSVINLANAVAFLVAGNEKKEIVKRVMAGRAHGLPAAMVRPASGNLSWFLDREAGSCLS